MVCENYPGINASGRVTIFIRRLTVIYLVTGCLMGAPLSAIGVVHSARGSMTAPEYEERGSSSFIRTIMGGSFPASFACNLEV